jgi:hypothetical protein
MKTVQIYNWLHFKEVLLKCFCWYLYGELQSYTYEYLNGERVVKENGLWERSSSTSNVIGNINPDWIGRDK